MPYAGDRIVADADAHVIEERDWLVDFADPKVRDRIRRPPSPLDEMMSRLLQDVEARRADPALQAAAARDVIKGNSIAAFGAFDKFERRQALDDLGFNRQLIFPTRSMRQFWRSPDLEVRNGGAQAYNRAISDFCRGDERLIPVGYVDLTDTPTAVDTLEEALELGCGAIWVAATPAGQRSPGHIDLDPFWSRLSQQDVPFTLHIGPMLRVHPAEYCFNGVDRNVVKGDADQMMFQDYMVLGVAPQMFLTALAHGGVFERFPDLRGAVIEYGADWVPDYLRRLDAGERYVFDQITTGREWGLDAKALMSAQIARSVKFTPYPSEDVGSLTEALGEDALMFSTDFPHSEGTDDPIQHFENSMGTLSRSAQAKFFSGNFEAIFRARQV